MRRPYIRIVAFTAWLMPSVALGTGKPAYVFKGTADTGDDAQKTLKVSLKWKKGKETKEKVVDVTVKDDDTAAEVAEKVRDAMNADEAVKADFTFAKDNTFTYHFAKGTPADGVKACGADVESEIDGLAQSGGVDPMNGTATFDINGPGSSGQLSLQVDSTVVTVSTTGLSASQIKQEAILEFQNAGIPAFLDPGNRVRIENMPTDNLPVSVPAASPLSGLAGGAGFLSTDPTLPVFADCTDEACLATPIPALPAWGAIVLASTVICLGWIVLRSRLIS